MSTQRKRRERRVAPNGTVLALTRKRLGYSQRTLADRIGVHHSLIAQVERGWCPVSERVAGLLAAELGLPLAVLLEPDEEKSA